MICIHHETLATHELVIPHATGTDRQPLCESCADDYPSRFVEPITHVECSICLREIERTHPEPPLCAGCEGTARAGGKLLKAEAEWIADGRPG